MTGAKHIQLNCCVFLDIFSIYMYVHCELAVKSAQAVESRSAVTIDGYSLWFPLTE
jgi:hypothetical protein